MHNWARAALREIYNEIGGSRVISIESATAVCATKSSLKLGLFFDMQSRKPLFIPKIARLS